MTRLDVPIWKTTADGEDILPSSGSDSAGDIWPRTGSDWLYLGFEELCDVFGEWRWEPVDAHRDGPEYVLVLTRT